MTDSAQPQPKQSPDPHVILTWVWRVLSILALAAIGVGLGLYMGREIGHDKWVLWVTASGLATYICVSVLDARHGLLMWLATAPFARFIHMNIELGRGIPNLTLNRLMTGVLVAMILAQLAIQRRKLAQVTWADFFLLLFVAGGTMSISSAIEGLKWAIQSYGDLIVIPIAIYYLARHLIRSQRDFRSVIHLLIIVGCYLAFLATREQITGKVWFYPEDRSVQYTSSIRRVVGLLGNPAYIAATIAMGVPWAWYMFLVEKHHRLWYLGAVGLMSTGVFFCMNRSGWIGLMISMAMLALFVKRFRRVFIILVLIGAVVGSIYWVMILTSTVVQERLTAEGPIEYRMQAWDVALRMARDHPLLGVGYDNYRHYYPRYAWWDIYLRATPTPHNTYLWVMLMGGIVAFGPFMLFLLAIAFGALCIRRQARDTAGVPYSEHELAGVFLASMAAIFAPAFVMDILAGYYNTMIMFLIMGAFFGMIQGERQLRERPPETGQPAPPVRPFWEEWSRPARGYQRVDDI